MAYWYLSVCRYVEHITYNVVCTYHHCYGFDKALERLLGWILILTLLPILDQNHKNCVLQIAKVPLQIGFRHLEPFLAFLVNI